MKLILFDDSKSSDSVTKKQAPFLVLTIAVLVTGTIFIWSIYQAYQSNQRQNTIYEEAVKTASLHVSGENFNESTKMSVKMAVMTGEPSWEKAYQENVSQLIEITEDAKSLANSPKEKLLFSRILEAHKKASETESRIFKLFHEGKIEEARLLASSGDYEAQKRVFLESLNQFLQEIDHFRSNSNEISNQNALWFLVAELILLTFFIWSWLAVIGNLRRSRQILLAKNAENERATQAISQSEEKFRTIVETTSEWIWAIDAESKITYSNPAIEKILGYRAEDLYGKNFLSLIHEDDQEEATAEFGKAVKENHPWTGLTYRWRHSDGSLRFLESSGVPVFDADGTLTAYRGANHDLTECKFAEAELQKSVALLSSAFEATNDAFMVVNLENKIVTYNKNFIEMWQIPDEIIKTSENEKALSFAMTQLINSDDFIKTTKHLNERPELRSYDLLFFKDGRIYERYSQPHNINGKIAGRILCFRDITESRKAEQSLLASRKSYQQLFDNNPHPAWIYDSETLEILAVNNETVSHYGYSRKEFLKMTLRDLHPAENFLYRTHNPSRNSDHVKGNYLSRHQKKDGDIIDIEIATRPIVFAGKNARLVMAVDITDRIRAEAAMRESEYKLRTLLDNMNEGLVQVDNNQIIEFVNDCFCKMTGYEREELIGMSSVDVFAGEEDVLILEEANEKRLKGISSQYELRIRKKCGEVLWVIIGGVPMVNAADEVVGSMGVFTDITERKLTEERLMHDALHDALTGLANRKLFVSHLQKAIERGKRSDQSLYAVLFLDFDRFKFINDSLGHAEGDNLLKQIARRLENLLRGGDLLARLSGDEFTILLNELNDAEDAVMIAKRILEDLNLPFKLGGQEVFMSASIGITLSHAGHHHAEDMLRDADIAMYRAKAKGKAQYQVFDETMHAYALNRFQLENELHHALQRGEFSMSYQPIVDVATNNLFGFEALIRWNHPERGLISPVDFIPAAEENGLVIPLGRWILYESCRQLREWQKRFPWTADLTVSVNLSCKQFLQHDLGEQVTAALISTQLDPRCLKLEITESHVMESSEKAVTMMNKLRSIGVGISLDDFGTGYSSLSYLHRLPVNYLKIDRSFVSRMVESSENREIVYTIVKLAQNLRMKVIAEGIENTEQFEQLKAVGCEYGQGYFISKPMDAETTGIYLDKNAREQFSALDVPIINVEINM